MNTTTSIVATGVVVAVGHWAQDKKMPIKVFVGLGITAIALAAMGEANTAFAEQFGLLILVAALLLYGVPIASGLGFLTERRDSGMF